MNRRSLLRALCALPVGLGGGCLFGISGGGSDREIEFDHVPRSELGAAELVEAGDELTATQRRFVERVIPDGTTTYGYRPFAYRQYLHADGTYYALSWTETGSADVERSVLVAESAAELTDDVVGFRDVSGEDSRALRCAIASVDERDDGPACVLHAGPDSAFTNRSATLSTEHNGQPLHLRVTRETVTLRRYEHSLETVGETRAALADYVAANDVDLEVAALSLSEEQRSMLRTAAETGRYREEAPYSEAYEELHETVLDRLGYDGLVLFEDAYYRADLRESHAD